ncbi:MAG: response regulator [Verrucomicrobia bacterium]|nr:response regulator [Verrucomicrobiota bacterium]MCH8526922.1 response regulator [Kiritimatiellia bacterium]
MKILVADDDFVSRTLVTRLLEKMGYEVEGYSNGAQALKRMLGENAPEMAILDWIMPEMDGPDVIRTLRREIENYPYLILLTNRNETSDKVEGLESGANDYLVKPVNPGELKARVHVGIRFLELQKKLDKNSKALLELERQQKAASLTQMAGGIAHHLNNKLQAVIGGLDLVLMGLTELDGPDRDEIQLLKQTHAAAEEAAEIGRKMLTYLSQNRGLPEVVNLGTVCRTVIAELVHDYPALQQASLLASNATYQILANPAEIHEVVLQILKNALEANPLHAPRISIEHVDALSCLKIPSNIPQVSSCGDLPENRHYIKLIVQDKGAGIASDRIRQIFDPFVTTKFTGRGMGLPVCLGIVKKLGGGIIVSCPKEGGTQVNLCLPEHQAEEKR